MTVISKFAYVATWDASELTKGLMNSRQQFLAHKKIVENSQTPMERYALGQKNLNNLIEKYPAIAGQKLRLEQELERQYLREEQAIRKLTLAELSRLRELQRDQPRPTTSTAATSGANQGFGKAALIGTAATAAYAAKNILGSLIEDSKDALQFSERTEASFRQFSKSGDKAAEMMEKLRSISKETGVSLRAMAGGTETLMIRRFLPDEAIDTMLRFAEITGGVPAKMDRLAIAMGQVRDMGRLQADELEQLVDAGWSPMNELMKITGLTAAQVKKEMEAGRVSYDLVAQALRNATDAGGDFDGRFNQLKGSVEDSARSSAAAWEQAFEKMGRAIKGPLLLLEELNRGAANLTASAADLIEKSNSVTPLDTGIMPGRFEEGTNGRSRFLAEQAKKFNESNKIAAAQKAEVDRQKEDAAIAARQKAAEAPTEKGEAYIKEQQKAIVDLQRQLNADKERELTIEEKIAQLRQKLTSDGLNKQEIERAVTLERQHDALKQQVDESNKIRRRNEMLEAAANRGVEAARGQDEAKVSAMADLMVARDRGKINNEEFNSASRKLVATDTRREALSPMMTVNSQESYKYFAQLQGQGEQVRMKFEQETLLVQKLQLQALQKIAERSNEPPITVARR